jgi:hypothetical protein
MTMMRLVVAMSVVVVGCAGEPASEPETAGTAVLPGTVAPTLRRHGPQPPACPATPRHRGKLSGCGTATVDGAMSRGEWRHADSVGFVANVPGGGTTRARLFVMNDATNLYAAVRFARAAVDPGNSLALELDNDHDCVSEVGDDALVMNPDIGGIVDDFRTDEPPCPAGVLCGFRDVDHGGTNDGDGAFANDGAVTVYEISHPLDSGDAGHDVALGVGDRVGMSLSLRMIGAGGVFPDDFGDTTFPEGGLLEVRIQRCRRGCDRDDARGVHPGDD